MLWRFLNGYVAAWRCVDEILTVTSEAGGVRIVGCDHHGNALVTFYDNWAQAERMWKHGYNYKCIEMWMQNWAATR